MDPFHIVTAVVLIAFVIAFIGVFGWQSITDALRDNKNKKSSNPYTRKDHGKNRPTR